MDALTAWWTANTDWIEAVGLSCPLWSFRDALYCVCVVASSFLAPQELDEAPEGVRALTPAVS